MDKSRQTMINIWMLKFQRLQTVLNNGKHLNGGFDSHHFHHEMKDRLRAVFSFHEGKKQGIEAMEWVRNSGSVKNIEVVDTKKMARCLRAILIYFLESEKVKSN